MKRLTIILIGCFTVMSLSAQNADSLMMLELKKEVKTLNKQVKNLKYQLTSLKKQHQEDQEKVKFALEENAAKDGKLKSEIENTNGALAQHQQSSDERIGAFENWAKQMIMILFILFGVLFLVLLILILLNRSAVNKSFIKLEAKVDNVKEEHELAHKELEKKYLDELEKVKEELKKK